MNFLKPCPDFCLGINHEQVGEGEGLLAAALGGITPPLNLSSLPPAASPLEVKVRSSLGILPQGKGVVYTETKNLIQHIPTTSTLTDRFGELILEMH